MKFVGKTDLKDGYTRWDWVVQYPINNYDVSVNIGNYTHFTDRFGDVPLDFYVLPETLEKARVQFAQAKGMHHEGWATYLEVLYVEHMFGHEAAIRYINAYKSKVQNQTPIITERGLHRTPAQDMYFKGALFLNTLRSVINNDERWWKLIHDVYQHFKYQNIMTEDMIQCVEGVSGGLCLRFYCPPHRAELSKTQIRKPGGGSNIVPLTEGAARVRAGGEHEPCWPAWAPDETFRKSSFVVRKASPLC